MKSFHKKDTIHISKIALRVIDLNKSAKFYNEVLGFEILKNDEEGITMGFIDNPMVRLVNAKTKKQKRAAGLFHIAFLVPNRVDFANWLAYHLSNDTPIDGASNHAVSEAVYLHDIDGNGIEVYTDTEASSWNWKDGSVKMVTERLDIENLFKEISNPTNKLPENTIIGHIHLSVLELQNSQNFYHLLGFETVLKMQSSAAFLSHNKYHHHLGMNIWNTFGGSPHIQEQADVEYFVIEYPTKEEVERVATILNENGITYREFAEGIIVRDPNNIEVHLEY